MEEGYGPVDPGMIMSFPAEQAPKGLEKGMKVCNCVWVGPGTVAPLLTCAWHRS